MKKQRAAATTPSAQVRAQSKEKLESVLKRGMTMQEADPFSHSSQIDSLTVIAKYFLSQVRLMASLVKERQMNCILAIQDEYSFSLCLSGAMDPRLPSSIRGAFFDLLTDLWVVRHPHTEIMVPA